MRCARDRVLQMARSKGYGFFVITNEISTIKNPRMYSCTVQLLKYNSDSVYQKPTPLLILPCFAISPSPLRTMLFCGKKTGMRG